MHLFYLKVYYCFARVWPVNAWFCQSCWFATRTCVAV